MINLLLSVIVFVGILFYGEKIVNRYFLLNKYKTILELLDYFLDKSYGVIYNDQILGFTSNGDRVLPPDEMETVERNFVKLSIELMGPANEKIFTSFFGNRMILIDNMLLFIRRELNQDALAKMIQQSETVKQ